MDISVFILRILFFDDFYYKLVLVFTLVASLWKFQASIHFKSIFFLSKKKKKKDCGSELFDFLSSNFSSLYLLQWIFNNGLLSEEFASV